MYAGSQFNTSKDSILFQELNYLIHLKFQWPQAREII